jgi:hypothetical protein
MARSDELRPRPLRLLLVEGDLAIAGEYLTIAVLKLLGDIPDFVRDRGHSPEAVLAPLQGDLQEVEARKRELEETIQREVSLLPATPRILGVARVVPSVPPAEEAEWHPSAEIEARGMEVAMRYEREQGREPEDVSTENLGFDIRSTAPDGSVRYIEVKARAGTGAIVLTPNEWLMAHRLRGEYWLYIVERAATDPKLYTIQDPASKLQPETVYEAVRYIVKDWKEAVSHDA